MVGANATKGHFFEIFKWIIFISPFSEDQWPVRRTINKREREHEPVALQWKQARIDRLICLTEVTHKYS